ncbi:MAG: substrate-binding domain-containing protein, partial [Planctomycetota bacterium]
RLRFRAFKMELIAGVNVTLEEAGYSALLLHAGGKVSNASSLGRILREHAIDGAIVVGTLPDNTRSHIEALTGRTVFLESNHWSDLACFRRDEVTAGRMVGEAVARAGYRSIVWFKGDMASQRLLNFSESERLAGLSEVAEQAGLPVRTFGHRTWQLPPDEELAFFDSLDPHTAVVSYDAANARWLEGACLRHDVVPARDFGLVCCDDIHEFDYTWNELSRVAFDRYRLGCLAAERMLGWLDTGDAPKSERVVDHWIEGALLPNRT